MEGSPEAVEADHERMDVNQMREFVMLNETERPSEDWLQDNPTVHDERHEKTQHAA
jgi:hypothetical protein